MSQQPIDEGWQPATDMLDVYVTDAPTVFARHPWTPLERLIRGWMYEPTTLHRVLVKRLGAAGAWRLNDAPVDLLLSANRLGDGVPWYFVRDNPRTGRRTDRLGLADCVVGSAAGPGHMTGALGGTVVPPLWNPVR